MRSALSAPGLLVGHFVVEFASPGVAYMAKAAGVDFLVLDMEHSGFGFETVKTVVTFCRAAELPVVVRVPSREYKDVARACDAGADGVMAPAVPDAATAREIVAAVKYPPEGMRGVSQGLIHDRYAGGAFPDKARAANERTAVLLQIETAGGVENAEAIAAVEGVDCLWVGHMDLSCSLGMPGQVQEPRFLEAQQRVAAAARRHGKAAGRMVPGAEEGAALFRDGFNVIACSNDVQTYKGALSAAVSALRARVAG